VNNRESIGVAFGLAYFIIPDKVIALHVTDEAWSSLNLVLGQRDRNRSIYNRMLGYVKDEERSRPLRTRIKLSQEQVLQWLVYAQSDSWERVTESAESLFRPGNEDMVIRYIKQLVQRTLNKNSFYVSLAMTRLLYNYTAQEARLLYDVLTHSDSARMKDVKYLHKQKARLMEELSGRFGGMLQTVTTQYRESRFAAQPVTERLALLVNDSLRRFVPWKTQCVVQQSFDLTAIPGLYTSTGSEDEDAMEINRIHTILHPDCFTLFVSGLSEFVSGLPSDSPDKKCKYDPPARRLAVPEFLMGAEIDPPDNRVHPPELEPEDYLRLERTRAELARKRREHRPRQLKISVDGVERASLDLGRENRIRLDIEPFSGVVEVRGEEADSDVKLAIILVPIYDIPPGESFKEWIVLEGGQKVTIRIWPGEEMLRVEISYSETKVLRAVAWRITRLSLWYRALVVRRVEIPAPGKDYSWAQRLALIIGVSGLLVALTLTWLHYRPNSPHQTLRQPTEPEAVATPSPEGSGTPHEVPSEGAQRVAKATWARDSAMNDAVVRLETMRGEPVSVEVPRRHPNLSIALRQMDSRGVAYSAYKVSLTTSNDKPIWRETMKSPAGSQGVPVHVLNITLFPESLGEAERFEILFEAKTPEGWKRLGRIRLHLAGN
jgi:hypothetical protein